MGYLIRPDFIVIGARTLLDGREGVQLTASNEVSKAEIDMFDTDHPWGDPFPGCHRARPTGASARDLTPGQGLCLDDQHDD